MPAKRKTTIAAAEKKAIKSEISTLKKAHRKISRDLVSEEKRIIKEIATLNRSRERSITSCDREMGKINRRISILQARL